MRIDRKGMGMGISTLVRAASRLSPTMAAYHLKRAFRNRLCLRYPGLYAAHIDRVTAAVPPLRQATTDSLTVPALVARYYHEEYLGEIDQIAEGKLTYFGQKVDFGSLSALDWNHEIPEEKDLHLWRMKLGHMGFLCPMVMAGDERHMAAVETIISEYREKARYDVPGCFSSYWFPYSVSHRVLALLSGYLIAKSQQRLHEGLMRKIEDFLRWNVGFILANIEHELRNNHVERNLAAICLYFDHVDGVPPKLARKIDRDVHAIIDALILEDGALIERSAMYQGLSVMALNVFATTSFLCSETRNLASRRLAQAERAWALMSHPDGEICLFNDSWFGEVPKASAIVRPQSFGPLEVLDKAGYVRLQNDDCFVLFDAGPIGPRWNPAHGHADFLSMEVDLGRKRFLVDPGTYQYSTGPRRSFERSARSHNGPHRDGVEPVEYYGCFKVGRMAEARLLSSSLTETAGEATGELRLRDGSARRRISLDREGPVVHDTWTGNAGSAVVRLLVQVEWLLTGWDGRGASFASESGEARIEVLDGSLETVTIGHWARNYLQDEEAHFLALRPVHQANHAMLRWRVTFEDKR